VSRGNVEIVRRHYEHRQSHGDFLEEIIAPDYVWDMSHFRGWQVVDIHDAGDDRVVGVVDQRGRSKSTGLPVDMRYAQVFTIRDGKHVRMEMYDDPDEALKAVGLAD
jgi:hypothetical protein